MANKPMGAHFLAGVLGVVNIRYNGVNLGKTTADTAIVIDQDIKDIIFQQDGTKYSDKVRTGKAIQVNCVFGIVNNALLGLLDEGVTVVGDNVKLGRDLYRSWKENSRVLELFRVDSDGVSSTDPLYKMTFFKAYPEITGELGYGADLQRSLSVTFHIFYDEVKSAWGYGGHMSSLW